MNNSEMVYLAWLRTHPGWHTANEIEPRRGPRETFYRAARRLIKWGYIERSETRVHETTGAPAYTYRAVPEALRTRVAAAAKAVEAQP